MSDTLPDTMSAGLIAVPRVINPLEALIGYQIRRASMVIGADLATRLDELSLTTITVSVLLLIEANPGITQSEIGRQLSIKRANMAPLAAQLTARDLIDRAATDGRSHGLSLTPQGQRLVDQAWLCIRANEARFLIGLEPSQIARLDALLCQVRRAP